jgi:hypothetical protein
MSEERGLVSSDAHFVKAFSKEAAPAEFDQEAPNFPADIKSHKGILILSIEWRRHLPKKIPPSVLNPPQALFSAGFSSPSSEPPS